MNEELGSKVQADLSLYASPATTMGQKFLRIRNHIDELQLELSKARVDPAHFATEPGVIQPDKDRPGKFVFVPSGIDKEPKKKLGAASEKVDNQDDPKKFAELSKSAGNSSGLPDNL